MVSYRRFAGLFAAAALLFTLVSCEEDDGGVDPALSAPFEGIYQTDEANNFLGGDTTDWKPRPQFKYGLDSLGHQALICTQSGVNPAFPNPFQQFATLQVTLSQRDSVWICAYAEPGGPIVETIFDGYLIAGRHYLHWATQLPAGIYRVYYKSIRGLDAYGDVEVEE